ncbi:UDP-glucuronate 4-epimerase 6-like [Ananas comosus]|uniref:UDP-glucuronate 4-epimerase 6-like n=1 Tax=Ananas comosus TaxID=4615 RepID=A0A6P5F4U6_ANACO|nr:UDP-glucuronate 4-epimerase 6-like [Ananas comosus]
MAPTPPDNSKTNKLERYNSYLLRRMSSANAAASSSSSSSSSSSHHHILFRASVLTALVLILLFTLHYPPLLLLVSNSGPRPSPHRSLLSSSSSASASAYGGAAWERDVRRSAAPRRGAGGLSVLVTGAAGFVGFHCSLALHRRGDGVVGLDNFNPYYDPSLKRARHGLLARRGVLVLEADINDAALLAALFAAHPFSHVLHLAAQAGVVYGLNTAAPFSESHRTDRPASLYAATKKAGEEIAHVYNHIYGLSVTGLRFFTVYGPWGRPDMAYFSFAKSILDGRPITLFRTADGADARRDFTYIDDVVRGCLGALDTARKSTGSGGQKRGPAQLRVYNLGNTSPLPVGRMVAILEELLGKKAKTHVVTMPRNGDVPYTHANVSLARHDFGYRPTTDLAAGLRKFVRWYVDYYGVVDVEIKESTEKTIMHDDDDVAAAEHAGASLASE